MANKPSDGTLSFIKVSRALVYVVYFFAITAIVFLVIGFVLLLFGANTTSSFVRFVYDIAAEFLQPFRGIFPPKQITETSYFSASGLFAIIMYSFFAAALHGLITWITVKQTEHENDLIEAQRENARLTK